MKKGNPMTKPCRVCGSTTYEPILHRLVRYDHICRECFRQEKREYFSKRSEKLRSLDHFQEDPIQRRRVFGRSLQD
jgi:hypothetical protein